MLLRKCTFKSRGLDRLVALENSVIACVKNRNNHKGKIEKLADRHDISPEDLIEKIEAKKGIQHT